MVESGPRELEMLAESTRLLDLMQANLARAQSWYAFGDALRRAGHIKDAQAAFETALRLATFCGARPLQSTIESALH